MQKNFRITNISETAVRLEHSPSGKFPENAPLNTDFKPYRGKSKLRVEVISGKVKVFSPPCVWHPGKIDDKNLGGTRLDLFWWHRNKKIPILPGAISRNGWWAYENKCRFYWNIRKRWVEKWDAQGYSDWYFSGYGERNFKQALKDYILTFGKIPRVPAWIFGLWYSRYWAFTDTEFEELVVKFRKNNIPLSVLVIDTDWRKHIWSGYAWSSKYFPEPEKFLSKIHKQGIKVGLNDHPGYGFPDFFPKGDCFGDELELNTAKRCLDWLDKRTIDVFKKEILGKFINIGIDFWWVDGWAGLKDRCELENRSHQLDPRISDSEKMLSQLWLNKHYYEATKEASEEKDTLILSRWGGPGSQRWPVWFSGDTFSNWDTLRYQVDFTSQAGNACVPYWSHDIGGFMGGKISTQLYIRWIQFGALSPVWRLHSNHGVREPWSYGRKALEIFKRFYSLRKKLLPIFVNLSEIAHRTGLPLIRPMYLEYPNLEESYKVKGQYLIGENILVAPVTKPIPPGKKTVDKDVFIPEGAWYEINTGIKIKGPKKIKIPTPLEWIPLFRKMGTLLLYFQIISLLYK